MTALASPRPFHQDTSPHNFPTATSLILYRVKMAGHPRPRSTEQCFQQWCNAVFANTLSPHFPLYAVAHKEVHSLLHLQRHPKLLFKATYQCFSTSYQKQHSQPIEKGITMNGCSVLGKVYTHPHSSFYSELVNNNSVQALQPLIQNPVVTPSVSFHLPQPKSSSSVLCWPLYIKLACVTSGQSIIYLGQSRQYCLFTIRFLTGLMVVCLHTDD